MTEKSGLISPISQGVRLVALIFIFALLLPTVSAQNIFLRSNVDPKPANTSRTKYADITADGNIAVMGSYGERGAFIFDISNPSNPVLKSTYNPTPTQQFLEAVVVGNRAYFGAGSNVSSGGGVHIVDISNPSAPVMLGRVSAANGGYDTIHEMVVDGDYLYINSNATSNRDLKVINISNPAQPRFVRNITPVNSGWVHAVFIKNGRMYTSGFSGSGANAGLTEIYDITNIEQQAPRLLGQVVSGTSTHSSWVSEDGNYLYVCRERFDGELLVYNITNPATPMLVKTIKAGDLGINAVCPHNPMVKGDRLYVAWYQAGVQVFDISNPADPKRIGQYDTYAPAYSEEVAREGAAALEAEPWDIICGRTELGQSLPTGFDGNWTAYPLLGHDKVLLADLATGLWVVDASRITTSANKVADFDGDGRTDFSRFTPANGLWTIEQSGNSAIKTIQFGAEGDRIAPSDFDGDGKTDIAVTRQTGNSLYWYVLNSSNNTFRGEQFGSAGDISIPADFDSDGKSDLAVFRPANGAWYMMRSTLGFRALQWGTNGDEPLTGDFDGDGKTDIAVARAAGGSKHWFIQPSSWTAMQSLQFGTATDKTLLGDFDGDAKTDIAVYRPSTGYWFIRNSRTNSLTSVQFGAPEDMAIPADYDGDAKADIAVYRPSTGSWYGLRSNGGTFFARQFGGGNDVPAPTGAQPRY